MLTKELKQFITSISAGKLAELYEAYVKEHGPGEVGGFIRELYKKEIITGDEFKRVQLFEKVELTHFVNTGANMDTGPHQGQRKGMPEIHAFTILESIESGAMGEILTARDNELGRTFAFKKMHEHVAESPTHVNRFFMEAQVTAQLQHPHIVPVYRMMEKDGDLGYAMMLIQGKTFTQLIQETKQQIDQDGKTDAEHAVPMLLDHFLKVCDAMHYAHRKGVIHRDLKPDNIMIGPYNEVYVMDWGIAKLIELDQESFDDLTLGLGMENEDEDRTHIGELLGTPVYMSPEQAGRENADLDHRSDIYALGLILFELVTLQRALSGDSKTQLLVKAQRAAINPLKPYSAKMSIPKPLAAIIRKATKRNREHRYATAKELARDIRRYLLGDAVNAMPDTVGQKIMRWMARHRLATLNIVAYSVLASVAVAGWSLYRHQQARLESVQTEKKISHFLITVADKTQAINSQFLIYQAILEGLAASATSLITRGEPDTAPYYTFPDYQLAERAPPDFSYSPVYKIPISVDWPDYKLAPGVEITEVEHLIKKINPLRHTFKRLLLKSHPDTGPAATQLDARDLIMNRGLPLAWAYVGFEQGFIINYPGKAAYAPEYDPRQRPWYKQTLETQTTHWINPYIDVSGRGWMLPCTTSLYDEEGNFLGVAAVEMPLRDIRRNLLRTAGMPGVEKSFLLNEAGRIVVSSEDSEQEYAAGILINTLSDLPLYPIKEVVTAIQNGKSGYYPYLDENREKLLAYYRLNSIGWYYLAQADAAQVLALSE